MLECLLVFGHAVNIKPTLEIGQHRYNTKRELTCIFFSNYE